MSLIVTPEDLFILKEYQWPNVYFHQKQVEVIESWCYNDETYCPAANKVGKDFVMGFIAVGSFEVCRIKNRTCRIVTTSVSAEHLDVLWGEIGRFLSTARRPLLHLRGGPLVVNSMEVRRVEEMKGMGTNSYNYLKGMVAKEPEKMQGHHAEFAGFMADESSAIRNEFYDAAQGWMNHGLFISNTVPCNNFFRDHCDEGDVPIARKRGAA